MSLFNSMFRNFTITYNNYPSTDLLDKYVCKYMVYGREVGESGTPHLQGFTSFVNARSLASVIKSLPGCHIEAARDALKAAEYCKKDGDFVERGIAPLAPKEAALKGIAERWELAKAGKFEELEPIHLKQYQYIHSKYTVVEDRVGLNNIWIQGKSGCGKSRYVRDSYQLFYSKPMSKWWDGYDGEEVVLIDDFDPSHGKFLAYHLKIWADHYSFNAEVKGGMLKIRPKTIIVTSQYPIHACFESAEDIEAITRRFTVVDMFVHSQYASMFNPPK